MRNRKKKCPSNQLRLMIYRNRGVFRFLSCTCRSFKEVYDILNSDANLRTK